MPGSKVPEGPLERLGDEVFHNRDGRGLGPTLGPGLSAEHQRELVERVLGEGTGFEAGPPAPPLSEASAALTELEDLTAFDEDEPEGLNEPQAEMYAHARAQGAGAADPIRRKTGGGADTEGL